MMHVRCNALRLQRIAMAAVLLMVFFAGRDGRAFDSADIPEARQDIAQEGKMAVHLYFGDRSAAVLRSEVRVIPVTGDLVDTIKRIVEALIAGPQSELMRTLPAKSGLRAVYCSNDGTATLDFTDALVSGHPGGCATELLSIYSIVNTLVLNLDGVEQVKILVAGRETTTLAGHVDLRDPLQAEMLLIQ